MTNIDRDGMFKQMIPLPLYCCFRGARPHIAGGQQKSTGFIKPDSLGSFL